MVAEVIRKVQSEKPVATSCNAPQQGRAKRARFDSPEPPAENMSPLVLETEMHDEAEEIDPNEPMDVIPRRKLPLHSGSPS